MPLEPKPPVTSPTGPPSWMAPVMPVVPDHELLRRIGGGSYGDVWLARTAVGTWRAVKVVFRDRFTDARPYEREFNGIQKFEPLSRGNEGFIDILQIGRNDAEGYFYYVMELADDAIAECGVQNAESQNPPPGIAPHSALRDPHSYVPKTLSKVLLQRGRLPLGECLELGVTLNLGLAHLHRAGLIHRDIKPSNLIFVGGVPKLADIGLVIETAEARSYVGTEGFIPPEGPNSPQADLYSLGKVLYEAGMGKDRKDFPEPFTQINDAPDSTQLLEFNAILLKACAANVKERYQSAEEMNADLALLQSGGSVRRQRKLAGQLRFVQRAGAIVTAFAAMVALGWWWQARQTAAVRNLADQNRVIAEERTTLAAEKEAAGQESHRRLVQIQTVNGLRAMDENEPARAALWFAEVLKSSEGEPDLKRRQRDRLGMLFRSVPKPIAMLSLNGQRSIMRLAPDDGSIIFAAHSHREGLGSGELRVLDYPSLQLRQAIMFSNILASPVPSPSGRWAIMPEKDRSRIWDLTSGSPVPGDLEMLGTTGISSWSPDETMIALTKANGTEVHLIEAPSGRRLVPPLQHSNKVEAIAFDPSGRWLATGTRIIKHRTPSAPDDTVGQARVWDAHTGDPITDWIEVEDEVDGLEFSHDGSGVAIYSRQGFVRNAGRAANLLRVINLPSALPRFAPLSLQDAVVSVAFSPDGRYLAAGSTDGTVSVWHAPTGQPLHQPLKHGNTSYAIRFSPDGAWLAATGVGTLLRIWDVRSGDTVLPDLNHESQVDRFEFTSDGHQLVTLARGGLLRVLDLTSAGPKLPRIGSEGGNEISAASFSPDGKQLAIVTAIGDWQLWDAATGRPDGDLHSPAREPMPTVATFTRRPSWSPEGRLLTVPVGDHTARIWEVATGQELEVRLRHSNYVNTATFSPDGLRIVTASEDGTARIWDPRTGKELTPPLQHGDRVGDAEFSPDGGRVVTASYDGTARIWNAATGQPFGPPMKHEGRVTKVTFSPDGTRLVMGGEGWITLRNATNGNQIGSAIRHASSVIQAVFSRDGRRILTTSADRTARVWDADSGQPVSPPLRHDHFVVCGDFSPDGKRVVTGDVGGTARIWDAATGEPLCPAFRHSQAVTCAAFSRDGRRMVTTSLAGTAQLWEVAPPDWTDAEFGAAARLLAAAGIGPSEQVEPLEGSQVEQGWEQMRARFQKSSASGEESNAAWHRRRLAFSEGLQQWFAAEFHARRLAKLQPGDPFAQTDLERIRVHRPPPRDPATPPELIDLSFFYNASLAIPWHGGGGNHLAEVPRGIQTFAGTRFDVRGLVQVVGTRFASQYPKEVTGLPINRKLERLQILHSIQGGQPPVGTRVGHYLAHFADGHHEEIPILYGRDARDWHEHPGVPVDATEAVIAWKGSNPFTRVAGTLSIRLFKRTWTNPAPEVEITRLDFVAEHTTAQPFLVALTAE